MTLAVRRIVREHDDVLIHDGQRSTNEIEMEPTQLLLIRVTALNNGRVWFNSLT